MNTALSAPFSLLLVSITAIGIFISWFIHDAYIYLKPQVREHHKNLLAEAVGKPVEQIFDIALKDHKIRDLFNKLRLKFMQLIILLVLSAISPILLSFFLAQPQLPWIHIAFAVPFSFGLIALISLVWDYTDLFHRV